MRHVWLGMLAVALAVGCNSSSTVPKEAPPVTYDSEAFAQALIAEYDKNKDSVLDGSELAACPALQTSLNTIDTDRDRKLSANELRARIEKYPQSPTGSMGFPCMVQLDGQSLADAVVTFVPEAAMSSVLKSATAKTDARGACNEFEIEGKKYRGIPAGLYRIQVTKDGAPIPPKYNTQTILGREVYLDPRGGQLTIELTLKSK